MIEATVDVNSKTSLLKRLWRVTAADFTKGAKAYTSLLNWGFMALAVWQVIGPWYADDAAKAQSAQVAQLQTDLSNALSRATSAETSLGQVKLGFEASQKDNAELAQKNDEMRQKLEANGEGPKQPMQKAALAPEPPINKVRVRKVPATKKDDPTAWENFIAWVQAQGAGTPGAN